jgi:hypothetical protein
MERKYLESRLDRFVRDGFREIHIKITRSNSHAAAAGAGAGHSGPWLLESTIVLQDGKQIIQRMAAFLWEATGEHQGVSLELLNSASGMVVSEAANWARARKKALSLFSKSPPTGMKTLIALQAAADEIVHDFENGIIGEKRMVRPDPVVQTIVNASIIGSDGAVLMNALGENIQQSSLQQQHLTKILDDMLASEDFKNLDEENRAALADTVDVLRDELKQPKPDKGKLSRWGKRLVELAYQLGLNVAASAIATALFAP